MGFPRVVNISHCITRDPVKGHPFWFHRSLEIAAQEIGLSLTHCGSIDQSSDSIRGSLIHSGRVRTASSVFGMWNLSKDTKAVSEVLNESSARSTIHIYEGGFREFLLARRLLRTYPKLTVLFNFNLTDPWHLIVEKRTIGAFLARTILSHEIRRMSTKFVPLAETRETSIRFSSAFKAKFVEYPLFSTIPTQRDERANKERSHDAVFFPADAHEMSRVLESIERVRNIRRDFKALIVPRWAFNLTSSELSYLAEQGINSVDGVLDVNAYKALYTDSKVAVFPYDSNYYLNTSSGRLLDAAAAGCYCIAPPASLPGRQILRQAWGSTYEEMSEEIALGLDLWKGFEPGTVPSAENSLRALMDLVMEANMKSTATPTKGVYVADFVVFTCILFGTGVRSWGPRLIQALQALRVHYGA